MKQDEYRKYARDAVRLASHASSTAKKALQIALAERWLDLADTEEKRQGSHSSTGMTGARSPRSIRRAISCAYVDA
jgi:hypothetical protein